MVTETPATMACEKEVHPATDLTGDARASQTLPTKADLTRVADIPLLNAKREPVPFGSLYPKDASHRTLICFVRHFFCGYCQEFLKTLFASITPESLESLALPTSLVIIGCGQPDLIDFYAEATSCPFPIYAEPTKQIYAELGMGRTLDLGPSRPEYQQKSLTSVVLQSFGQAARAGRNALKGGDFAQVGGEFLLQGDEVVFCHRMSNTRDHIEIPQIRKILDMSAAPTPDRRKRGSPALNGREASHHHSRSKQEAAVEDVNENKENVSVATSTVVT